MRARFGQRIKHALRRFVHTKSGVEESAAPPATGERCQSARSARIGGLLWLGLDLPREEEHGREIANRYSLLQFAADYRTGVLPEKSFAILSYETAKLGLGRVPAMMTRRVREKYRDEHGKVQTEIRRGLHLPDLWRSGGGGI